jgi:hypothetical protein
MCLPMLPMSYAADAIFSYAMSRQAFRISLNAMPGMLIGSWPCVWFNAHHLIKSPAILSPANGYPQVRPPENSLEALAPPRDRTPDLALRAAQRSPTARRRDARCQSQPAASSFRSSLLADVVEFLSALLDGPELAR